MNTAVFTLLATASTLLGQSQPQMILMPAGFSPSVLSPDGSTAAGPVAVPAGSGTGYVIGRWTAGAGVAVLPRSPYELTWPAGDYPIALSSDGSIIGAQVGSRQNKAARWSLEYGFQIAAQLDTGAQQVAPKAMSADGRFIIGSASTSAGYRAYQADFALLTSQELSQIGNPPELSSAGATAVDAAGHKVVGSYQPRFQPYVTCLWENSSTVTQLNPPLPLARWYPSRISGDGRVITGLGDTPQNPNVLVPFRWSAESGATLVPIPPQAQSSFIAYVDFTGQTMAGNAQVAGVQQALLWLPASPVQTLDGYLDSLGIWRDGFHFFEISGLSADGKVLLAQASRGNDGASWMIRLPGALPLCAADVGKTGGGVGPDGVLDNNDFVVFIAYFFTRNARADIGKQGGVRGSDFVLDNNDFVQFVDQFFSGCL